MREAQLRELNIRFGTLPKYWRLKLYLQRTLVLRGSPRHLQIYSCEGLTRNDAVNLITAYVYFFELVLVSRQSGPGLNPVIGSNRNERLFPARTSSLAHRTEGFGWALWRHGLQLGQTTAVRPRFGCSRARKLFPDDDIHRRFSGFSCGWKAEIKWRRDALFSKGQTGFLTLLFVQSASIREI